jgi:MFS family permease
MPRIVTTHAVDDDRLTLLRTPRSDLVLERADGPDRFTAVGGPFSRYERTLTVEPDGRVTETIDFRLAVPFWWILFVLPFRWGLRHRRDGGQPWWAPPEALDARAATVLGLLCSIAIVEGYLGTLLTQTMTYAAREFGASRGTQGTTLAAVRVGVLVTFAAAALADRRGRRPVLVGTLAIGCVLAAAGALAPNLVWLGSSQALSRGCAGAAGLLIAIISAEEMPKGARAYAYSLIALTTSLGAGMCLWVLPVADVSTRSWRLVYLVPLLGLLVVYAVGRRLPESRRFVREHASASSPRRALASRRQRLMLLAAAGFLLALFAAPAFELQNDFLRRDRGFSAARISLFTLLTSTPAALGIVFGGRVADVRGRRLLGAVAIAGGTIATVLMFAVAGWPMWAWAVIGSVIGASAVPIIGVYRAELFPTGLRGRAAGTIDLVALCGSALGLVLAGTLADRWGGFAGPIALLAAGPLVVAALVLVAFPETARRSLEELNPEDELQASAASPAPSPPPPGRAS